MFILTPLNRSIRMGTKLNWLLRGFLLLFLWLGGLSSGFALPNEKLENSMLKSSGEMLGQDTLRFLVGSPLVASETDEDGLKVLQQPAEIHLENDFPLDLDNIDLDDFDRNLDLNDFEAQLDCDSGDSQRPAEDFEEQFPEDLELENGSTGFVGTDSNGQVN